MANEFFTILTATGKAKLAAAQTSGTPLQITQMAVGDGDNGAYYNPVESQTTLKHETWRGALNNLSVDQSNPNWIVAELVIPDTVGGFYIREVGLFDSTGALIAVGKFPESYKPTLAAGSNKQLYVRMILEVSNASAVTLLIDPSVVLATRATVDQRIAEELAKLDYKPSVKVATTAAIALTGLQTIDGVVLAAGDRVLVKDQAEAKDNGIYVAAAGAWAWAADADASIEVTPGLFVSVEQGTANADSSWQLVTDGAVTLGTTGLAFEMVAGKTGAVAGTYRSVTVNARGQVVGGTNPNTLSGYSIAVASQAEAEAGSDDTKPMTPSKVAAAIAKRAIPAGIPLDWLGLSPPSWAVVRDGSALSRANYASLFAAICPTRSGTLTNGSAAVTGLSTTLDMWVGMPVEGTGVPAGTTVASITSASAITLSANATGGAQTLTLFPFGYGSGGSATTFGVPDDRGLHTRSYDSGRGYEQSTLTASTTNASNVLSGIASTRGLYVGMPVSGTGIPANTTIASITGATTATMSANATATGTAVALTVTGRQVGAEGSDAIQNITGFVQGPSGTSATGAFAVSPASQIAGGTSSSLREGSMTFDASRVARTGPETQVKRRIYLPIITLGA